MALYASELRQKIAAVLALQSLPGAEVAVRIGLPKQRVHAEICNMVMVGEIKVVGSAHDAGFVEGYRATTRAYGMPDALILGPVPTQPQTGVLHHPKPVRRVSRQGSGVIAPAPYRTGYRWGGQPL